MKIIYTCIMKIDQKIGKYLTTTEFRIEDLEKKTFLRWLSKKDNVFDIARKNSVFPFLFQKDRVQIKPSNFYLIFDEIGDKADVILYEFNQNTTQEFFFDVIEEIFFKYKQDDLENTYMKTYLYFPFQIANVFSKARYIYQINIFHMDTLQSYRNLDKKKSALDDWLTESDIALYHEFTENTAMEYKDRFAYVDYLKVFLHRWSEYNNQYIKIDIEKIEGFENAFLLPNTFLASVKNYSTTIASVLDAMDFKFFEEVAMQQRALVSIMEVDLAKIEVTRKKEPVPAKQVLLALEKKALSCETSIKEVYNKFKREKWFDKEYASDYKDLIDLVFGANSVYYDAADQRKVFFFDIKKSFEEYYDSGNRSKDLKYFFNQAWILKVKKVQKELITKY